MPGWNEASVDELLADPIVRDLMTADRVDPGELRTLLYRVQRTIECYAMGRGGPGTLAGFAQLYRANLDRTTPKTGPARPRLSEKRERLADPSRSLIVPLASRFCGETGAPSGVRQ